MSVAGGLDMETRDGALQDKALNLTFENIDFVSGASVLVRGPENGNIVFDRDTFVAGNANCTNGGSPSGPSGIFNLLYSTATPTTPSGVTVENSVFVAPADLWNPYRAMQTGASLTVANNVFSGFLARSSAASCNHVDTLQLFSGTHGTSGGVRFTGNLCYDDYGCIMAFDGTSDNTITDNVCFDIERSCVILYSDRGSQVSHNTQQTAGADPSRCATEPATQACAGSALLENDHKPGEPVSAGEKYTDNVAGSPPNIADPGSLAANANNLWPGASSPNISGSPSFVGGANPTTWAGFALRPGSAGHAGGSDGQDVGIRLSAGGPPTGGGSPPVSQVPPALSGSAVRGRTLSTTDGTWAITGDVPTITTYQWLDCPTPTFSPRACAPIQPQTYPTSANGPSYALQASDVGRYVVCEVTVTNANGQVNATSRPVGPVRS